MDSRISSGSTSRFWPRVMAGILSIAIPACRITALPDPDFTPRYLLVSITALLSLLLLFFSGKKQRTDFIRVSYHRAIGIGLAWLLWLVVDSFGTRDPGAGMLEAIRWADSLLLVVIASFVFLDNQFLRLEWPKWVFVSWLLGSVALGQQVLIGWSNGYSGWANYAMGGWSGNKNFLAEWFLFQSFFLLYGWQHPDRRWRVALRCAWMITLLEIVFLHSIATWVAGVVVLILFLWDRSSLRGRWGMAALGFVLLAAGVFGLTRNNVMPAPIDITRNDLQQSDSRFERRLMWRNSLRLIADHPFGGAGTAAWKIEQAKYGIGGTSFLNNGYVGFEHPHNEYLAVLAETGILGGILLLTLFILLYRGVAGSPEQEQVRQLSRYAVVAFAVVSLFAYPMSRDLSWISLLMHLGVLLATIQRTSWSVVSTSKAGWVMVSLMLFSGLSVWAWTSRLSGEYHLGQSSAARWRKIHDRSYREAIRAERFFFHTDRSGTPVAWYAGDAAFRVGDVDAAHRLLSTAYRYNPYHLKTLNDLGTLEEQRGHADEAMMRYREALAISPSFVEARLNAAAAYYNTGGLDSAYGALKKIPLPLRPRSKDEYQYQVFRRAILRKIVLTTTGFESLTDSVLVDGMGADCYDISGTCEDFRRCLQEKGDKP